MNEDDDVQFTDANAIHGLDPDAVDLEEKIPKPPDDWSPPPRALKVRMNDRSKQSTVQEDEIDATSCHVLTRRPVSTNIIHSQHQRNESAVRAPLTQKRTGSERVTDGSSTTKIGS